MPQPALWEDAPPVEASASLHDAAARLEAALGRLEALIEAGPLQSERFRRPSGEAADLKAELAAARERERALESAATAASQALGRAMDDVRRALADDPPEDAAPPRAEGDGGESALDPAAERVEDLGP